MLVGYCGNEPKNPTLFEQVAKSCGQPLIVRFNSYGGLAANKLYTTKTGALLAIEGTLLDTSGEELSATLENQVAAVLAETQGQWAIAYLSEKLTLARDHFGACQLFYARAGSTVWFSSSLRLLLTIPEIARTRKLNLEALYAYLAFSFIPAPYTLLQNVQAVPPATALTFDSTLPHALDLFPLPETDINPLTLTDWQAALQTRLESAMRRRLPNPTKEVALSLSGGLNSSAVGAWLKHLNIKFRAFHLDFGDGFNGEGYQARNVAQHLGVPLEIIPIAPGKDTGRALQEMVRELEQPFGDPVTLPLHMLYRTIAQQGYSTVFNGEGGDQLFAGWPNKAMFAAELYGAEDRAESYLHTFHHFYGKQIAAHLFGERLNEVAKATDLRRIIEPYLETPPLSGLFARLRWTNYRLKGSQNIMPRAATLARAAGLEMHAPLFDLDLARFALTIPGDMLQNGSVEKYLFKLTLGNMLTPEIIELPKRGMGVPAAEWCLGALRPLVKELVGKNLLKRGLFRPDYVRQLLAGEDLPSEIRARRVGEKLWQLLILELWLQLFFDGKAL